MTAETKRINALLPELIASNKAGISIDQLANSCGYLSWKLRRLMLRVGYIPPKKKTGPQRDIKLPRETRKCQCSNACAETFQCLPKSLKKYVNKEHTLRAASLNYSGPNSSNWQGGLTPLHTLIRNSLEYNEWRTKIFKRDNYSCQKCPAYACSLQAHHKVPFTIILRNFLQNYSQFSPLEDKEILVRLAMTWAPFWDTDNGETLCGECHRKAETHKWSKR